MEEKNNKVAGTPAVTAPAPQAPVPAVPAKPAKKSNKKFAAGCAAVFAGAFLVFFILILVFLSSSGKDLTPIYQMLGIDPENLRGALITLLNLALGFVAFIAFLAFLVGVFRLITAQKGDKKAKTRGAITTFISAMVLFLSVMGLFLTAINLNVPSSEKKPSGIITEPAVTTELTAPIQIKFDASRIGVDRKYQAILYEWDFDDGSTRQTGKTVTHTFKKKGDGLSQVVLTMTLKDKVTSELFKIQQMHDVSIANEKVQATFTANPVKGKAPLLVNFDAGKSSDPDGEILAYEWDFDDDGQFDDASGVTAQTTFDKIGKYEVTLRVTDNNQEFATETQEIDVNEGDNPKPVIKILDVENLEDMLAKGKTYTFDASESISPIGAITKYLWDFGDSTKPAETRMANHSFEKEGVFEVKLKVTDETGLEGEAVLQVKVGASSQGPTAVIKTLPEKLEGTIPFRVNFDGSASTDPNNDIVDYEWDFNGDGEFDALGATVATTYQKSGEYFAVLRVTDAKNGQNTARVSVKVSAQDIQARISADITQGEAPLTVAFDASSSSYPDGQIVSYKWDFGDGSPVRLDIAKVTYKYTQIGNFEAKVTAVASDGKESTVSLPVTIRPVSVTACFSATLESGPAPLTVTFDPKCSRGSIIQYTWDFSGLDSSRERKPTFTFEEAGDYTVGLEVSDNQNIVNTFTKVIHVTQ